MNIVKKLSRNKDLKYKCKEDNTMISKPGFCRNCKENKDEM